MYRTITDISYHAKVAIHYEENQRSIGRIPACMTLSSS